jgi:hypothetical protein
LEITQYSGLQIKRKICILLFPFIFHRYFKNKKSEKLERQNLPVEKLIGIVGQISGRQRRRIASGESESHSADVDGFRLDNLDDPRLSWTDGPGREDVSIAEFGVVADGSSAVGSHADVDSVSARVKRQRLEGVMAVVAQRRRRWEVLEDGGWCGRLYRVVGLQLLLEVVVTSRARNGRKGQGRDLVRPSVQVERVHRDEEVGLAARPWHLLLVVHLLMGQVVRALVHVVGGQGATDSAAGCARMQRGGTPPCRRVAHGIIVQTASRIFKEKKEAMD